jgi:hypothetical protein
MLRRMALVKTDVSEELSASIIRVTRIGKLGTTLAVTSNRRTLQRNTSVLTRATRSNIPEDGILHSHCRDNLKSHISGIYLPYYTVSQYKIGPMATPKAKRLAVGYPTLRPG